MGCEIVDKFCLTGQVKVLWLLLTLWRTFWRDISWVIYNSQLPKNGLSSVTWLRMCQINVIFLVLRSGFDRQYDTVQILQAGVVWLQEMQWRVKLRRHTQTHRHTDAQTHRHTQEPTDHNCLSHHHCARMSCCWRWQSRFWQQLTRIGRWFINP